jgi:hypothetical protein
LPDPIFNPIKRVHAMTDSAQIKANLLALLSQHGRATALDEDDYAKLNAMIADLEAITPRIAGEVEHVVEGSWQTEFASFGIKHSMGKNQEHDSDLALQSFNRMPKVPVRVSNLIQEIDQAAKAYNNVDAPRWRASGKSGCLWHLSYR